MVDDNASLSERDHEALRLVMAFYCIPEPERRAEVQALVYAYAKESAELVDGLAHLVNE